MLRIAVCIVSFLYVQLGWATKTTINPVMQDGMPGYELLISELAKNNALQLKFKLSSLTSYPINLDASDKNDDYSLKIGPITNYQDAQKLEHKLNNELSLTQNNATLTTSTSDAIAPTPSAPAPKPVLDEKLWNLQGADIRAVIGEVSRITGKNFVIDPRVQGKISLISSTPISKKELYPTFLSILQVSGYAAIPTGKFIKIIPNIEAKTQAGDLLNQLKTPPQGDDLLVAVVPIHYVPSEQLVPVLRPLMPPWSNISAYGPANTLIISGRANNIKQIIRIIRQVDTSSVSDVDVIPLKHALAMDVASTLKELTKNTQQMGNHTPTTVAADDRSNALLLSGNKTERIKLRLLIAKLDKKSPYGTDSNTQVIYLNYLRAEDLVPILAGVAQANFSGNVGTTIGTVTRPEIDSTSPIANLVSPASGSNQGLASNNFPSPPPAANPAATPNTTGATNQSEGSTKPTVQIIAEPNTNSIILNAPAALIHTLKSVIHQLDIRPAQLLIEAIVAEIDERDFKNLGIEWGSNQQTKKPDGFRSGFAIINSKTSLNDFQAQIYALANAQRANILSTPSVVVLDNRQAKILVGKQVSVASTTYPNNASGTTTASPYVTYDRVNVALHLYVRPQITRDEGIHLQIDQGNDTLDPASTLQPTYPTFKISSIVTSVHIESGDIVVLGGLTQNSMGSDNNTLPILGDIPGIGRLFQRNSQNREKRVLIVFIRPCILKDDKTASLISSGKYYQTRQEELETLRPQPYDPRYKNTVLPPMQQDALPRPFMTMPQKRPFFAPRAKNTK